MRHRWIRSFLLPALLLLACGAQAAMDWYQQPFRIMTGDKPLDTHDVQGIAYAAPFLVDLDGDGKRDLVVGNYNGHFRFHRNIGTDASPRFGQVSSDLYANGEAAAVPNFCCVAAGPQVVDLDADGQLDLVSGSYAPGAIYWFKGQGGLKFADRQLLTEPSGLPVLAKPITHPYASYEERDQALYAGKVTVNYASNVAFADWDNDGTMDMIIGTGHGDLFLRLGMQSSRDSDWGPAFVPTKSQPTFIPPDSSALFGRPGIPNEIQVQGEKAIPVDHAAPATADWDGDGLWDLIVGSLTGEVFLLRNTGKPGAPEFKSRERLLGPGATLQWDSPEETPRPGTRAQIQAVDYNLDGKMDLLVGCWSVTQQPRPGLSGTDKREVRRLRAELAALDRQVHFDNSHFRGAFNGYKKNEAVLAKMQSLEKQLANYTVLNEEGSAWHVHGYVWVLLRK